MAQHLDLEEQEQIEQLKHFWNTWGTLITAVLVLVFGALAAWNGYQYWQNRQATQAAGLFDAFDMAARAGDMQKMEQAFADLRASYASTVQAAQAGMLLAKAQVDKDQLDAAKGTLAWVASHAGDEAYQALAHLRLSGVLMEQKALDEALQQVAGNFPAPFEALAADRKGDIFMLMDKRKEAAAAYAQAYKTFAAESQYRRLVEIKLQALGAAPEANAASAPSPATKG
ncbi:MAG: YfgM family protein [Burkholderiaceae bacterium]